jgi:hypothetical protein
MGTRDYGAPLGEAGAKLPVLGQALAEAVEALGDRLAGSVRERLGTLVDLDPRDDSTPREQLGEGGAVVRALADRLVVEDDAADELLRALGGEEEVAVGPPGLLRGLHVDRREALLDRPRRLVGGQDALARSNQRPRDGLEVLQLLHGHRTPPSALSRARISRLESGLRGRSSVGRARASQA